MQLDDDDGADCVDSCAADDAVAGSNKMVVTNVQENNDTYVCCKSLERPPLQHPQYLYYVHNNMNTHANQTCWNFLISVVIWILFSFDLIRE